MSLEARIVLEANRPRFFKVGCRTSREPMADLLVLITLRRAGGFFYLLVLHMGEICISGPRNCLIYLVQWSMDSRQKDTRFFRTPNDTCYAMIPKTPALD